MSATALHGISVQGFRSLRRLGGDFYVSGEEEFALAGVELRPINVIVGANGSGKSNFLEVFAFLQAIRAGRLQRYVARAGGAGRILHFGRRKTPVMSIEIWFQTGREAWLDGYQIGLEATEDDGLAPSTEMVMMWDRKNSPAPYDDFAGPAPPTPGEAWVSVPLDAGGGVPSGYAGRAQKRVREHFRGWRRFQFHDTSSASPMRATCDVGDNRSLRQDGANLAAFVYRLRHTHPESYGLICSTVRLVAPFFDEFQIEPLALNAEKLQLEWRHRGSDAHFGASSLSDGTLRFMALSTLLLQPVELRPKAILIDEPELGLHPYAIGLLASMIRSASVDTQVIVATQSPILLDYFEPEEVLVAERKDEETKLRRLETAPLREWLEDYSLGQLWEKNELGGRPGSE